MNNPVDSPARSPLERRSADRARRIKLAQLVAWVRWFAVPLTFLGAVYAGRPMSVRLSAVGVGVFLALYNLVITVSPRLPSRLMEPAAVLGLVGDFLVITAYLFLYNSASIDSTYTFYIIVG